MASATSHRVSGAVGTLLVGGTEDPRATMLRRGGVTVNWTSAGAVRRVSSFRERPMSHVVDTDMALPTLYLHMLDRRFLPTAGQMNNALRSGNDNSELLLVLPETYLADASVASAGVDVSLACSLETVLTFLRSQGEVETSACTARAGGLGSQSWSCAINVHRLYFRLWASRPKCVVTLDKGLFGVPADADLYLFAQNHESVGYMSEDVREAFGICIQDLPSSHSEDLRALGVFVKVFFEGGFAYNKKENIGASSYLPKVVGIGALGVTPAFEGQGGITTGYPYRFDAKFFQYLDTVPVSIAGISAMSERHGRYGLCFTRCVFVWDGGALESEGKLDFCAPAPHGGFFYMPRDLAQYQTLGGLLYAFGEARDNLEASASVAAQAPPAGQAPA